MDGDDLVKNNVSGKTVGWNVSNYLSTRVRANRTIILIRMHVVRYIVPEDGDDERHPNVFRVESAGPLTLAVLKQEFPLPGIYFFRALRTIGGQQLWMDVIEDSSLVVPEGEEANIFLKVSRLQTASGSSHHGSRAHDASKVCLFFET